MSVFQLCRFSFPSPDFEGNQHQRKLQKFSGFSWGLQRSGVRQSQGAKEVCLLAQVVPAHSGVVEK
jgi:hypothetical protein